jgi:hypothetical protein
MSQSGLTGCLKSTMSAQLHELIRKWQATMVSTQLNHIMQAMKNKDDQNGGII